MMANSASVPCSPRENRRATARLEETVEAVSPESNANSADDTLAEARRLAEATVWCSPDSGSPAGFDRRCRWITKFGRPAIFHLRCGTLWI